MALTNAERQARHRERQKMAAVSAGGLTPQQINDRQVVMAASLFPIAPTAGGNPRPCFMGLSPSQWSKASDELVDYFGMREARARWNEEWQDYRVRVDRTRARAEQIIASGTPRAKKIARDHGNAVLCRAYDIDPKLGPEAVKSVT